MRSLLSAVFLALAGMLFFEGATSWGQDSDFRWQRWTFAGEGHAANAGPWRPRQGSDRSEYLSFFRVHPKNPNFMLQATDLGRLVYTNSALGGVEFVAANMPLRHGGTAAFNPHEAQTAYVLMDHPNVTSASESLGGWWRTEDEGVSWQRILQTTARRTLLNLLEVDRNVNRRNYIYVGTTRDGLRRSVDNGANWSTVAFSGQQIWTMSQNADGSALYVIVGDPAVSTALYRINLQTQNFGSPQLLTTNAAKFVDMHPSNPDVGLIVRGNDLRRFTFTTATNAYAESAVLRTENAMTLARYNPNNANHIVMVADFGFLNKFQWSTDGGTSWSTWTGSNGFSTNVLDYGPANFSNPNWQLRSAWPPNGLHPYLNFDFVQGQPTHVLGWLTSYNKGPTRSTNNGQNFVPFAHGGNFKNTQQLAVGGDSRFIATAEEEGPVKLSADGGLTWRGYHRYNTAAFPTNEAEFERWRYRSSWGVGIHPTNPNIVIATVGWDPVRVMRTTDFGATWAAVSSIAVPTDTAEWDRFGRSLQVHWHRQDPNVVYVANLRNTNGGSDFSTGTTNIVNQVSAMSDQDGDLIVSKMDGTEWYFSRDRGTTWNTMPNPPPASDGLTRAVYSPSHYGVAIDPNPLRNPNLGSTRYPRLLIGGEDGVWKFEATNQNATAGAWSLTSTAGMVGANNYNLLNNRRWLTFTAFDPRPGKHHIAYAMGGFTGQHRRGQLAYRQLYRSTDSGNSWSPIHGGVIPGEVPDAINFVHPVVSHDRGALMAMDFTGLYVFGPDLVGRWTFDNTLSDTSAGSHASSLSSGSPTYVAGRSGQAIQLNGSQAINVMASSDFYLQDMTLSLWMRPDVALGSMASATPELIHFADAAANTGFMLGVQPSGNNLSFLAHRGASAAERISTSYTESGAGVWIHVVATWDGRTMRLFKNGALQSAQTLPTPAALNVATGIPTLRLGQGFQGAIDDVRIYSRALSADEVGQLSSLLEAPVLSAPSVTGTSSMTINWTNVVNETGYVLEVRAGGAGAAWQALSTTGANVTTFAATGLNTGTSYSFRVRATNASGASAWSNITSAQTFSTPVEAASNLSATVQSASSVRLTWMDRAVAETGYIVQRRDSLGNWSDIVTNLPANTTSYTDNTAVSATEYVYRVRAFSAEETGSPSNEATAITPGIFTDPTSISTYIAPGATTERTVHLLNKSAQSQSFTMNYPGPASPYILGISGQAGGPAYVWNDISTTGTEISGLRNQNDASVEISLGGMAFPFFDGVYTSAWVSSNGFISFTSDSTQPTHANLHGGNTAAPPALIAAVWRDLRLYNNRGSRIYYRKVDNDTFVIQFHRLCRNGFSSNSAQATFQIVLKSNGDIFIYYNQYALSNHEYSVGLQNAESNAGISAAFNPSNNFLSGGKALRFQRASDWLFVSSKTVTVPGNSSAAVPLTLNAAQLPLGSYSKTVSVTSDNNYQPVFSFDIHLTVSSDTAFPPDAPSSLSATAVSSTSVQLEWSDNSSTETGFQIERSFSTTGPFSLLAVTGANATSYLDTGLETNVTYYYRVRAVNADGPSAWASGAFATPTASNIQVHTFDTAGALAANFTQNGTSTDRWNEVDGVGIGGSRALAANAGVSVPGSAWSTAIPGGQSRTISVMFQWQTASASGGQPLYLGLGPDPTYVPTLDNTAGTASAYHFFLSIDKNQTLEGGGANFNNPRLRLQNRPNGSVSNALSANTAASLTNGNWYQLRLVLTHNGEGAYAAQGFLDDYGATGLSLVGNVLTTNGNFNNPALAADFTTHVFIGGQNVLNRGISVIDNLIVSGLGEILPSGPINLEAIPQGQSSVQLTWSDTSINETGFRLERSSTAVDGPFTLLATLDPDTTEYTDTLISPGTTYYYRVTAFNSGGISDFSNTASATIVSSPPSAPSVLSASAQSSFSILLSWADNSSDETAFVLERSTSLGGVFSAVSEVGPNVTSYLDTGLAAGTAYFYRVRGLNGAGLSASSNVANATTLAAQNFSFDTPGDLSTHFTQNGVLADQWKESVTGGIGGSRGLVADVGRSVVGSSWNTGIPGGQTRTLSVMFQWQTATSSGGQPLYLGLGPDPAYVPTLDSTAGSASAYHFYIALDKNLTLAGGAANFNNPRLRLQNRPNGSVSSVTTANAAAELISGNWYQLRLVLTYNGDGTYSTQGFLDDFGSTGLALVRNVLAASGNFTNAALASDASAHVFLGGQSVVNRGIAVVDNLFINGVTQTPPAAPSQLNATAQGGAGIHLTWSDNATNESVYLIERALAADGPFAQLASLVPDTTAFSDTQIAVGTTYFYRVSALNSGGASAFTDVVSATVHPPPPSAPSGTTATAQSAFSVLVAWTDNATNETAFVLERSLAADGTFSTLQELAANTVSFLDTNLAPGVSYHYRVRAINSGGSSSGSNVASVTTPAAELFTFDTVGDLAAQFTQNGVLADQWKEVSGSGIGGSRALAADAGRSVAGSSWSTSLHGGQTRTVSVMFQWQTATVSGGQPFYLGFGPDPAYVPTLDSTAGSASAYHFYIALDKNLTLAGGAANFNNPRLRLQNRPNGAVTSAISANASSELTNGNWYQLRLVFTHSGGGSYTAQGFLDDYGSAGGSLVGNVLTVSGAFTNAALSADPTTHVFFGGQNVLNRGVAVIDNLFIGDVTSPLPAAPTSPGAVAQSDTAILVSWADASGNESGFRIERSAFADGPFSTLATVGVNQTSYVDSGLAPAVTWFYRIVAFNVFGDSAPTPAFSAITRTSLENWRLSNNLPIDLAADTDGDGLSNLLEYALAASPLTPDMAKLPQAAVDGSGYLTLRFERVADPNLVYEVWASTDLVEWGQAPIWSSTGVQNVAGPITVEDSAPLSNEGRRFLRLKVRMP